MTSRSALSRALAASFLAGDLDVDSLVQRGSQLLGRRWRWLRPLCQRVALRFAAGPRPRQAVLIRFLSSDPGLQRAWSKHQPTLADQLTGPPAMCPVEAARTWPLPVIRSSAELADWLDVAINRLDWLADLRRMECKCVEPRLRHYRYRPMLKRFGQVRLVESPKPRLKQLQRRILTGILEHIPPHEAAHGFRRGRSIKTFAAPHARRCIVVKIDLQDFFPSISMARVAALFRTAGYPEPVADSLAGLCTNSTPQDIWDDVRKRDEVRLEVRQLHDPAQRYARPHLPQGAPTSPALANLIAYRLDCRLSSLAAAAGAIYTRYADDLAFSGDEVFTRIAHRFHLQACATVLEEGFLVHHRKTRIMRQGVSQRLAGLIVNQRLNVPRRDFDRLKATLTNCIRHGASSQNRSHHQDFRCHLQGKVAYVEMINPEKGRRLRELFERIVW